MEKEDKDIVVGCLVVVLMVVISFMCTLFWGWALQIVLAWLGLTIPYYVAVLAVMLVRYIARLFKK